MIYHFSNDTFGAEFQRAMADIARLEHIAFETVVERSPYISRIDRLRALVSRKSQPAVRVVKNVNDASFADTIAPESSGIITGFGTIFRAATIAKFDRLINLHPSVLPLYRGPAPTVCCIANGERRSGFTFHEVTPAIDAGPVIFQAVVDVAGIADPLVMARVIAEAAVPTFRDVVRALAGLGEMPSARADAYAVYSVEHRYCRGVHTPHSVA